MERTHLTPINSPHVINTYYLLNSCKVSKVFPETTSPLFIRASSITFPFLPAVYPHTYYSLENAKP